uniref:Uncharacterized protein n=1 Tax=Arabidopsis thaliana TaxID=3702 RepID=Q0WMG1_ARATH|nr:hypothetical protein [Arabidopsis thaliana]
MLLHSNHSFYHSHFLYLPLMQESHLPASGQRLDHLYMRFSHVPYKPKFSRF